MIRTQPGPERHEARVSGPVIRFVVFLIGMAVIIAWLAADNGEYASAARFFLKELFRQMF